MNFFEQFSKPKLPAGFGLTKIKDVDALPLEIKASAAQLGIEPLALAKAISYETAGTFDPWKKGPTTKWGTHRGLIQWGEPQAKQYGVYKDQPTDEQMIAVTEYLKNAGVKPGMGELDIYSAINAGRVGRYNASDRPGKTVRTHVAAMDAHTPNAQAFLGGGGGTENFFAKFGRGSKAGAAVPGAEDAGFGSGTAKRMAEYEGLSPTDAAAKYRGDWADTFSNIWDTFSDSRKLTSVGANAVEAGAQAVAHPIETAKKIGNYYYENPDAAATDLAFAAFPARYAAKAVEKTPSASMPRASIREEGELYKTGGERMNTAKRSEVPVHVDEVLKGLSGFHARLKEKGIRVSPKLHPKTNEALKEFSYFMRAKPMKQDPEPATMLALHEVRQLAANAAEEIHPKSGRPTPDAMLANELLDTIDEVMANHPEWENFARGKNEISRSLKSQSIMRIGKKARNSTQWDRGDQAGAIRNAVNSFLKSPEARFLTKEDIAELNRIKKYGLTEMVGGQGSLSPMALLIGRGLETMTGLPYGSLYVAGGIARQAANAKKSNMLERMSERIRAGE